MRNKLREYSKFQWKVAYFINYVNFRYTYMVVSKVQFRNKKINHFLVTNPLRVLKGKDILFLVFLVSCLILFIYFIPFSANFTITYLYLYFIFTFFWLFIIRFLFSIRLLLLLIKLSSLLAYAWIRWFSLHVCSIFKFQCGPTHQLSTREIIYNVTWVDCNPQRSASFPTPEPD